MVAEINSVADALRLAFANALSTLFTFIPRLVGAVIVLLIGLVVGWLVGGLVARALRAVKFDQIAGRAGIDDFLRNAGVRMDPAGVVGQIVKWFIFLIFFQVAADTLGLPQVTLILNQILAFLPRIVVALVILLVGALAGNLLASVVRGSVGATRLGDPALLGNLARHGVIAFAVVAVLSQLQIAPEVVNALWTALIGGLALALALAFGLGLRDAAGSVGAGQLLKGEIRPGMQIGVDGAGGTVERVGVVYTTIGTASGSIKVPNAELARKTILVAGGGVGGEQPRVQRRPQAAGQD